MTERQHIYEDLNESSSTSPGGSKQLEILPSPNSKRGRQLFPDPLIFHQARRLQRPPRFYRPPIFLPDANILQIRQHAQKGCGWQGGGGSLLYLLHLPWQVGEVSCRRLCTQDTTPPASSNCLFLFLYLPLSRSKLDGGSMKKSALDAWNRSLIIVPIICHRCCLHRWQVCLRCR
jgi:hypothetical protein